MITIFNRKELFLTSSLGELEKIKSKLEQHHIEYCIRTIDQETASVCGRNRRAAFGSLGMNSNATKLYYIYVRKNDLNEAQIYIR